MPNTDNIFQGETQAPGGSFKVPANAYNGIAFVNKTGSTVAFEFFASGSWTMNSKYLPECNPVGHPEAFKDKSLVKDTTFKLPTVLPGCLILRRNYGEDYNEYQEVGIYKQLTLYPEEKVFFLCNDVYGEVNPKTGYNDNEGVLNVEWKFLEYVAEC